MQNELKPCPFCGGTNLKTGGDDKVVGVWCLTCQAAGPNHYGSREWNDRASPTNLENAERAEMEPKPIICIGQPTISRLLAGESVEIDAAIMIPASDLREPNVDGSPLLEWAVKRWQEQVMNRPLVNVHRRSLDDVWRQVIRWAGGDPEKLVGPPHDELLAMESKR